MLRRYLFIMACIGLLSVSLSEKVFACGGGDLGPSTLDAIDNIDTVVVYATILEVDDYGMNALLQVHAYYKGLGPDKIIASHYHTGYVMGKVMHLYDDGCNRTLDTYVDPILPYQDAYFFLEYNPSTGVYQVKDDILYVEDGTVTYEDDILHYHESGSTSYYMREALTVSPEEFNQALLDRSVQTGVYIPTTNLNPLKRFLIITTENGTRYQLNPDHTLVELEDPPDIVAISPHGAHVALRYSEETIIFQYMWTHLSPYDDYSVDTNEELPLFRHRLMQGREALFSNDSNLVVTWDDRQLSLALFRQTSASEYGNKISLLLLKQVIVAGQPVAVLWSADSSTLLWQDGSGIWHWNVVEEEEATLIVPSATLDDLDAQLLDVSNYGRYVRYGNREEWLLLDVRTGEALQNFLVSPDERFFMPTQTQRFRNDYAYGDHIGCSLPLRTSCATQNRRIINIDDMMILGEDIFGTVDCDPDTKDCQLVVQSWHPGNYRVSRGFHEDPRHQIFKIHDLRQIIYDPFYHQTLIAVGDYELYQSIDLYQGLQNLYLDLEGRIDSPVVSIEWGQSLFAYAFLFTATHYLP